MANKRLQMAFLFSLGIHSLFLSPLLSRFVQMDKPHLKNIEVTYINIKEVEKPLSRPAPILKDRLSLKEGVIKKTAPLPKKPAPPQEKEIPEPLKIEKPKEELRKPINLNTISKSSPSSHTTNYLRAVRDDIDQYIHDNYSASMGTGEAEIYFVLNRDGSFHSVTIIKADFQGNDRLKGLCLDSIKNCAPFKPFPEDLDIPQAAFNISISFKE